MSQKDRSTLKANFKDGETPGEDQFSNLIDSCMNIVDDGIFSLDTDNLGIGGSNEDANLSIFGNMAIASKSSETSDNGLFVSGRTGIGSDSNIQAPKAQLAVDGGVYIGDGDMDPGDNNLQVDGDISAYNVTSNTATIGTSQGGGAYTLHVDGSVNITSNVTLDDKLFLSTSHHIETAQVKAKNSSDLTLTESTGNGLTIADSTGDVSTAGNLKMPNSSSNHIELPNVRAKSGGSLQLTNNSGTGLTIDSAGAVTIDNTLQVQGKLVLPDDTIVRHSKLVSITTTTGSAGDEFDTTLSADTYFVYGIDWKIDVTDHAESSEGHYPRTYNISTLRPYIKSGNWYIEYKLANIHYNINATTTSDITFNYYAVKLNYTDNT